MLSYAKLGLIAATAIFIATNHSEAYAAAGSSAPTSVKPAAPITPKSTSKAPAITPLPPKELLPVMTKPFGMPGVVGWQNDKWEGNDFLGSVSSNISVSVEILKGESVPNTLSETALEADMRDILTKNTLTPQADVPEGPPLPFLHILLFIYPVEKDRYVIFGAARLFEQIGVLRKNFSPAGYWQGITWENQDVSPATNADLDAKLKSTVEKLTVSFIKRYRLYNPTNPDSKQHNRRASAATPPG